MWVMCTRAASTSVCLCVLIGRALHVCEHVDMWPHQQQMRLCRCPVLILHHLTGVCASVWALTCGFSYAKPPREGSTAFMHVWRTPMDCVNVQPWYGIRANGTCRCSDPCDKHTGVTPTAWNQICPTLVGDEATARHRVNAAGEKRSTRMPSHVTLRDPQRRPVGAGGAVVGSCMAQLPGGGHIATWGEYSLRSPNVSDD